MKDSKGDPGEVLRTLLGDLRADDYVAFRFGKRIDVALKALDALGGGTDLRLVEAKLNEALALMRAGKGGGAVAAASKSRPKAAKELAHGPA